MKNVDLTYTAFKSIVAAKGLLAQYSETPDRYSLFAVESNISWETSVVKDGGADVTDFEANHKANYNKPLEIKAGPGRPQRFAASPQPINTTQHWKGYKLTLPQGDTSAYIDISFPALVYLRGGLIYCNESVDESSYLSLDVLYGANDMVILEGLVDTCYTVAGTRLNFQSPESMAVAPELKLRLSLNRDNAAASDQTVYLVAEYFK